MTYRALRSFTGLICMVKGEVRDISDDGIAKDLIKSGYIIALNEDKPKTTKGSKPSKKKDNKVGDIQDG